MDRRLKGVLYSITIKGYSCNIDTSVNIEYIDDLSEIEEIQYLSPNHSSIAFSSIYVDDLLVLCSKEYKDSIVYITKNIRLDFTFKQLLFIQKKAKDTKNKDLINRYDFINFNPCGWTGEHIKDLINHEEILKSNKDTKKDIKEIHNKMRIKLNNDLDSYVYEETINNILQHANYDSLNEIKDATELRFIYERINAYYAVRYAEIIINSPFGRSIGGILNADEKFDGIHFTDITSMSDDLKNELFEKAKKLYYILN